MAICALQAQGQPTTRSAATQPIVVRHGLRLPDFQLHDPWILADEPSKTYYLYTSASPRATGSNRFGAMAYKSKDLATWDGPYVVFQIPDGVWANPMHGAWAPEVHFYKGKYYLFITLHNNDAIIAQPPDVWKVNHKRGTTIAVADSPEGPFKLVKEDGPIPPADFMTLDGTFYVDPAGQPWMVYAHEWIQKIDGTMEAIKLKDDLSSSVGDPIFLFKASDAPWLNEQMTPSRKELNFVTDGPEMYRTKDGHLLMLWASYDTKGYVETLARSKSGKIEGPWEQLPPLVGNDSGHGMLFHTFDGKLMMVLHHPFKAPAHGKIYEMEDAGDTLKVIRPMDDLNEKKQ
ncbi:MAG TPA: glycoside hydrolase family 43 protein [Tepidisphaeraceae bacterium]|nr:glycoside hydrolase family 43 protein [Tepidisphaeraceae bacterium]